MILLKNCLAVLREPGRIERNVDILIREGRVEPGEIDKSGEVVDCSGKIVIPGLVNSHTHAAMTLLRGIEDDLPLEPWLREKIWPAEARLKEEDVYAGTLLTCLEMLKNGITCFADMYFFGEAVKRAVEESRIRCVFFQAVLDAETPDSKTPEQAMKNLSRLKESELFVPGIGPHSVYTCSRETLEAVSELSSEGYPVHIHVSETEKEVYESVRLHGARPVEVLKNTGLLGPGTSVAHAVHLSEREIRMLADSGTTAVNCPASNLKLFAGIAPVPEMRESGVPVALGTDSAASNNSLNMFTEMKFASLVQRLGGRIFPTKEVLNSAFGSRAIWRTGRITAGSPADLAIIDARSAGVQPPRSLESCLVFSFSGPVWGTVVNGELVVENGRHRILDEETVIKKAVRASERLSEL